MLKNGNLVSSSLHDKHINIWNFKNETLNKYIISDYPIKSLEVLRNDNIVAA